MITIDEAYGDPPSFYIDNKSETTKNNLGVLYDKINTNPLTLYFNSNQASINLDAAQRQKVATISKQFEKIKGSTSKVVFHSNASSKTSMYMRLEIDRANLLHITY
ncbi:hypothetical protein [Maribacter sp. ACAM166]|uniref:hypothetical protein n=1 Tax=Maribacter sp. ACAM166 TaxID=2508996 RepID=UPI0010FF1A0E|nr:hypothetical protein [Maribacter sp. ACAM166]TLP73156.1 hypothetical protein ES765_17665 [Maribacter sp. ACAM166]